MLEMVITGLCVLSLASGTPSIKCPTQAGHNIRLTFPVDAEFIDAWPKDGAGNDLPADYSGLNATFVVDDGFELELVGADSSEALTKVGLDQLLHRGELKGTFKAGAKFWDKFPAIDKGKLEAIRPLKRCFEVPAGSSVADKVPMESVRWTRKAKGLKIRWISGGSRVELSLKASATPLRVVLANDTGRLLGGPAPSGTEFNHWIHAADLWVSAPTHPAACKADKESKAWAAKWTSRPICNLLLDQ